MRHTEFYVRGLCEQIKICVLMFGSPKKFIQRVEEERGINVTLFSIVFFLFLIGHFNNILKGIFIPRVGGFILSNVLFVIYMWCLIYIAKGERKLDSIINVSLYVHILYMLINVSQEMGLVALIVYSIGHLIAIIIKMAYLVKVFKCELERVKYIFYIEVGIIVLFGVNNLMIYVGNQIMYMQKLLFYHLLG